MLRGGHRVKGLAVEEMDAAYRRFQLIIHGPALAHAIATAIELDVFEFLRERGAASLEEVALHAQIAPEKARVLMLALCASETVSKQDERYSNTELAQECLTGQGKFNWSPVILGWKRFQYPAFKHLTAALQDGTNSVALADYEGQGKSLYERVSSTPDLEKFFHNTVVAPLTLQSLEGLRGNAELASVSRMLDIGGGDGTTAAWLAKQYDSMEITVIDSSSVVDLARATSELPPRVDMIAADFFHDDLPSGYDGILFNHTLEPFAEEMLEPLLRRSFEALESGGRVFIYGVNAPEDGNGGLHAARCSLYLNVLATGSGMTYSVADYERMLRSVGFVDIHAQTGFPSEHGLVVGCKPGI